MKKIEAIIKPFKLDDVKASLGSITGLTVAEVTNCGLDGRYDRYHAGEGSDVSPKVKLEIITEDADAARVASAIELAARTGHEGEDGDGTITILPVDEVVRIRTGERGDAAV